MRVRVGGVDALVRETAGCGPSVVSARVTVCSNYLSTCLPTYPPTPPTHPPTHLPTCRPPTCLPAYLPGQAGQDGVYAAATSRASRQHLHRSAGTGGLSGERRAAPAPRTQARPIFLGPGTDPNPDQTPAGSSSGPRSSPQAQTPHPAPCPDRPLPQPRRMQVSAVPYGARVFVISGNSHGPLEDSFWMQLLRQVSKGGSQVK